MRVYIVKAKGCIRLAGTQGDARAYRQAIVDERGVSKKAVEITELDLSTSKPALLEFLNGVLEQVDGNVDFQLPGLTSDGGGDED